MTNRSRKQFELLSDTKPYVKRASEPTDIIWENLGIPKSRFRRNQILVLLLIWSLIGAGFLFFWFLKYKSVKQLKKYPDYPTCEVFYNKFDVN